jgi:uncharacterized protein
MAVPGDFSSVSPVGRNSRIGSLDILRGFAVLGILVMNIQSFSMPGAAYINPASYGNLEGVNRWVWILSHVFASGKFINIFSMLFGAGIVIFTGKAESKGYPGALLHFRRMMWLLVLGMMHAYLLWEGDILVSYALCGMLVYFLRDLSPIRLIRLAILFFLVPPVLDIIFGITLPFWPEEQVAGVWESWQPDQTVILSEIRSMRGGWFEQMEYRVPASLFLQTSYFLTETFWHVTALILAGMALFKWNVFSAEKSSLFYRRLMLTGLVTGFGLSVSGVIFNFMNNWRLGYSMFFGPQFNYLGAAAVALGYTGMIMLLVRSGIWKRVGTLLASVGRMAFTNYILQSLICTLIFYGHGLGLFGSMERQFQVLVVAGIWSFQLFLSWVWLRYFRFGPLEWLWRSLTYRRFQPFLL